MPAPGTIDRTHIRLMRRCSGCAENIHEPISRARVGHPQHPALPSRTLDQDLMHHRGESMATQTTVERLEEEGIALWIPTKCRATITEGRPAKEVAWRTSGVVKPSLTGSPRSRHQSSSVGTVYKPVVSTSPRRVRQEG